jgi:hypothetical protein
LPLQRYNLSRMSLYTLRNIRDAFSVVICIFIFSMGIVGLCNYKQQEGLILGIMAVVGSLGAMVYIIRKGWRNGSKKDGSNNQV